MNKVSTLNIIDASVYLKAGTHGSMGKDREAYGFPTGGLAMLMKEVVTSNSQYNQAVVVFDSRTDRRNYMPEYKATRKADFRTLAQAIAIMPKLEAAGVPCYKIDGFEADDLIDKIVKDNYDKFKKIIIHTNDMDLARNVDREGKVEINCPTSRSYDVTREVWMDVVNLATHDSKTLQKIKEHIPTGLDINYKNWQYAVQKDAVVLYNTLTLHKTIYGDKSDNIKPISDKATCNKLYKDILAHFEREYGMLEFTNNQMLMFNWLFNDETGNTLPQELQDKITARLFVMYPREVPHELPVEFSVHDIVKLREICHIFRIHEVYEKITPGTKLSTLAPEETKYLRNLAEDITKGYSALSQGLLPEEGYDGIDLFDNSTIVSGDNIGGF